MTKEHVFTTGEVIGLTSLKLSTVQRYIKTFPGFFSPGARLTDRRRRLTAQDVKTLLVVKYLYSIRESKSEITKALSGEKVIPALSWLEITYALDIASSADKARKECEAIYKKMQVDLHQHKCFIQDRVTEFRRTAAIVSAELHETKMEMDRLTTKQNADSRMMFDNLRALEAGNGLSDSQKRNLNKINKILAHEQQEYILSKRQQAAADNLIAQRESQLEKVTIKKSNFIESFGNMLYKFSLPEDERNDLEYSEAVSRWKDLEQNE